MVNRRLEPRHLESFREYLVREEKSVTTIEKYLRDVNMFLEYVGDFEITKEVTGLFKNELQEKGYAVRSIDSMLASLNSLLTFLGWTDCKVKSLRYQRQIYCPEERELTKEEYYRLL